MSELQTGTPAHGAVELREDVPLKGIGGNAGGVGAAWCGGAGGPRVLAASFGALSALVTLALLTQLYAGDYQVVPHGAVSTSAAACSRAGAATLKAGGRALDAAAAAALCLAALAPNPTALDASGALVYWEYRKRRSQVPLVAEWGGSADLGVQAGVQRPPRLVVALATLHARLGALPWSAVVQPALDLDKAVPVEVGGVLEPAVTTQRPEPRLLAYLASLQHNTSTELAAAWPGWVRLGDSGGEAGSGVRAGRWRVYAAGAGAGVATEALAAALQPDVTDIDAAISKAIAELNAATAVDTGAALAVGPGAPALASGMAVVDRLDTYVALVTGVSTARGAAGITADGWARDDPPGQLDLAPALMVDEHVCGTRFVIGAESSSALAQAGAALAWEGAGGVERPRVGDAGGASRPAAVNVVQQRGDELLSHADSRGGGLASRF